MATLHDKNRVVCCYCCTSAAVPSGGSDTCFSSCYFCTSAAASSNGSGTCFSSCYCCTSAAVCSGGSGTCLGSCCFCTSEAVCSGGSGTCCSSCCLCIAAAVLSRSCKIWWHSQGQGQSSPKPLSAASRFLAGASASLHQPARRVPASLTVSLTGDLCQVTL